MENLHLLKTNKPSRLYSGNNGNFVFGIIKTSIQSKNNDFTNQHICITNNEKIKVGDWVLYTRGNRIHYQKLEDKNDVELANIEDSGAFKIILTTDQDLIKDGVQAIDDEFLEWFVKNPSCEYAIVDEEEDFYKIFIPSVNIEEEIIIPKEEPKQDFPMQKLIDIMENDEELKPKQETLEEAAYRLSAEKFEPKNIAFMLGFIEGAKWQQERSHSDEEVINILVEFSAEIKKVWNITEWFNKFRKK